VNMQRIKILIGISSFVFIVWSSRYYLPFVHELEGVPSNHSGRFIEIKLKCGSSVSGVSITVYNGSVFIYEPEKLEVLDIIEIISAKFGIYGKHQETTIRWVFLGTFLTITRGVVAVISAPDGILGTATKLIIKLRAHIEARHFFNEYDTKKTTVFKIQNWLKFLLYGVSNEQINKNIMRKLQP